MVDGYPASSPEHGLQWGKRCVLTGRFNQLFSSPALPGSPHLPYELELCMVSIGQMITLPVSHCRVVYLLLFHCSFYPPSPALLPSLSVVSSTILTLAPSSVPPSQLLISIISFKIWITNSITNYYNSPIIGSSAGPSQLHHSSSITGSITSVTLLALGPDLFLTSWLCCWFYHLF